MYVYYEQILILQCFLGYYLLIGAPHVFKRETNMKQLISVCLSSPIMYI